MNKNLLIGIILLTFFGLGGYYLYQSMSTPEQTTQTNTAGNLTNPTDTSTSNTTINETQLAQPNNPLGDDRPTNPAAVSGLAPDSSELNAESSGQGRYDVYSPDYLTRYPTATKVLFFHANWCPTCKAADADITQNADQIPADVVILKTDYDEESALKQKYNITYQHTFVVVDDEGNEITKWNGGQLQDILERI